MCKTFIFGHYFLTLLLEITNSGLGFGYQNLFYTNVQLFWIFSIGNKNGLTNFMKTVLSSDDNQCKIMLRTYIHTYIYIYVISQ